MGHDLHRAIGRLSSLDGLNQIESARPVKKEGGREPSYLILCFSIQLSIHRSLCDLLDNVFWSINRTSNDTVPRDKITTP